MGLSVLTHRRPFDVRRLQPSPAQPCAPTNRSRLQWRAGASATVDGDTFVVDRPGRYRVSVAQGEASILVELVAFHATVLEDRRLLNYGPGSGTSQTTRPPHERRRILDGVLTDPRYTDLFEACTPIHPIPMGVNLAEYGGHYGG